MGRKLGLTQAKLEALADYEDSDRLTATEKLGLRYADAMTNTPVDVPEALFDHLSQHFTPEQLVEITSSIAWENYRARFDHAFGIESEQFSEGQYCPRPVTTTQG